jgi:DNA uptake protein ComE-like DNA-binding protein
LIRRGARPPSRWIISAVLALVLAAGVALRVDEPAPAQFEVVRGEPPTAEEAYAGFLPDGRIDLNAASTDLLATLPSIGEVTAEEIVRARAERPFDSTSQLADCCQLSASELAEIERLAGVQ